MKNIILIACCMVTLAATAQDKPGTTTARMPWNWMKGPKPVMIKTIGVTFPEFEGLNARMAAFPQYEQLKGHLFTLSLGSMHNMNNFITKLSVEGGSSLSGDPDEKSSNVCMFGGGFDIGYDVVPAKRVMVYPMVGIGAEKYYAKFYRDVNAVNFNDVVNSPTTENNIRSLKLTNTFFTYRFGLGLGLNSADGNHGIGLHGGYVGSFKDDKAWRSREDQSLAGAPVDDLQRWSVSLVITGSMMGMHK